MRAAEHDLVPILRDAYFITICYARRDAVKAVSFVLMLPPLPFCPSAIPPHQRGGGLSNDDVIANIGWWFITSFNAPRHYQCGLHLHEPSGLATLFCQARRSLHGVHQYLRLKLVDVDI